MAKENKNEKQRIRRKGLSRKLSRHWKQWQDFSSIAERFFPYFRKNLKRQCIS
jgi:hypothetical protein